MQPNKPTTPAELSLKLQELVKQQEQVTAQLGQMLQDQLVVQLVRGTVEEALKHAIAVRHWLTDGIGIAQQTAVNEKQREDLAFKSSPKDDKYKDNDNN